MGTLRQTGRGETGEGGPSEGGGPRYLFTVAPDKTRIEREAFPHQFGGEDGRRGKGKYSIGPRRKGEGALPLTGEKSPYHPAVTKERKRLCGGEGDHVPYS